MDGVDIAEDSLRRYTDSKYFASIIGYTGKISQEEYDALTKEQKKKYSLSDIVGNLDWSRPWMRCFRERKVRSAIIRIMSGK